MFVLIYYITKPLTSLLLRKHRDGGNLRPRSRLIIFNSIISNRTGLPIILIVSEKSVFLFPLKTLALNKHWKEDTFLKNIPNQNNGLWKGVFKIVASSMWDSWVLRYFLNTRLTSTIQHTYLFHSEFNIMSGTD